MMVGAVSLIEMTFHARHASLGDHEMTLFWITFDSHNLLPWFIAAILTIAGFVLVRLSLPDLRDAWDDANTPQKGTA